MRDYTLGEWIVILTLTIGLIFGLFHLSEYDIEQQAKYEQEYNCQELCKKCNENSSR